MLVLSRREGEAVCVGDGVVVTVVRICGNRVRVGVAAENKPILRVEIKEKANAAEKERASTARTEDERDAA